MGISTNQGGRDPAAIHDDEAAEISAITEKTAPVAADMILIEDSAAANAKKMVQVGNVPIPDVGARVYNNANISVNDSTNTLLTFNSERYDTDGLHSTVSNTSRLTAPKTGKYLIAGHVLWANDADGFRQSAILLNGSTIIAVSQRPPIITGQGCNNNISTIYNLTAGEYVELRVYHNAGGALNVTYDANESPEFMMQLIGEV